MASTYIKLPVAIVDVDNFPVSVEVSNDVGNPLPVSQVGPWEVLEAPAVPTYGEVTAVGAATPTVVVSKLIALETRLVSVIATGTNWASYEVQLNGNTIAKKYAYIAGGLEIDFNFRPGIEVFPNDLIEVIVEHNRPDTGDFQSTILLQA